MLRDSEVQRPGRKLRRPVAPAPQPRQHQARPRPVPRVQRRAAPRHEARDRAVLRIHHARRSQHPRFPRRRLHFPERAARQATTASPASEAASSGASRSPAISHRGGVLTQASVLTVSSYPTRTSPVIRGKWILENILDSPPPPPPPNVPNLDEKAIGTTGSLREQLEQHRANPACNACHARMDPLGFGLENYDAIGRWRSQDGNFPSTPLARLPGGRTFDGPDGLKQLCSKPTADHSRGCLSREAAHLRAGPWSGRLRQACCTIDRESHRG